MDNDDLREIEEDKSLLNDMAKKGISKTIKTMPLGTKVLLISIGGLVIFLLFFIVLVSTISMLFFFNGNNNGDGSSNLTYVGINSEDNYWWPIGGSYEELDGIGFATGNPTATTISSRYGYRTYYYKGKLVEDFHEGIDIKSSGKTDYVIAAASGTIHAVGLCDDNIQGEDCQYGMGNYVTIKHTNGNYTRYAHLLQDSITVSVGDKVEQGQIIGIMGNSGQSTGIHLDFKIFTSGYPRGAANPESYISATNPRPVSTE